MLKNFFRTAVRSMVRHKVYTIINFTGLTCGLAVALLIFTYVRHELSYDQFHQKIDRLYRIAYTAPNGLDLARCPPPISPLMSSYFPEVETSSRVYGRNLSVSRPNSSDVFEETAVYFVDPAFGEMMTLEYVRGPGTNSLTQPFTLLINEEMALKYFGKDDPIGETLILGGTQSFKVVGVVRDFPETSHLRFNMLVPFENMFDLEAPGDAERLRRNLDINFVVSHSFTYVLLKEGSNPLSVDAKFDDFIKKHALPQLQVGQAFRLMPVKDIHLSSTLVGEPTPVNSWSNLYMFIGAGILTLFIAAINYINLSTAQSLTRIKEIGVRKILGSMKSHLIIQFLAEGLLFCFLSLVISFAAFLMLLPLLNELTGMELTASGAIDFTLILFALVLAMVLTLLSSAYPSWFISNFNSVGALKGSGTQGHGSQILRKALVVFQLGIASLLVFGSLMVMRQLDYLYDRELGFKKDQIINVSLFSQNLNGIFRQHDSTFMSRLDVFRHSIESNADIQGTALTSRVPGLGMVYHETVPDGFSQEDHLYVASLSVDSDFFSTYDSRLVAGRLFSKENVSDLSAFIVNETAVKEFKWGSPEEAIGKTLVHAGRKGSVIGVISDFHFASLTTPITGLILNMNENTYSSLSIRFEGDPMLMVNQLSEAWSQIFPEKGFQYTFLDEQLRQQYQNFQSFGSMIKAFAIVAMLICCLGVYGLVLFVVQRKVKEIGVRKVLGSSIGQILGLIYKDFAILHCVGFVIAAPLCYYLLTMWLENFTYRLSPDAISFVISFFVVLLIVILTVSYQAFRAASANPVKSLRTE